MPQMAPIWWSTLFMLFLMTYFTMMMMMYFFNMYKLNIEKVKSSKSNKNLFWKW